MGESAPRIARRIRLAAAPLATAAVLALVLVAGAGPARAQGPAYVATPPTAGALYRDGQDGRYLLGGTWLYRQDLLDVGVSQGWNRDIADTSGWTPVGVPNSYNAADLSTLSMNGYVGWYRRDFTLPAGAFARSVKRRDQRWIIRFESINYAAQVWCNGRLIGSHVGAYLPFEFDLKNLRPGVNRLIVRVDDRRATNSIPPGPSGGWWNYGGILREVYLRAVSGVDISQAQIRPVLACSTCAATIEDVATIRNLTARKQKVTASGYYGSRRLTFGSATIPAHGTWTATASVRFPHPHLWSIDDPYLYRATISVDDAQRHRLSRFVDYSGVRSVTVTSDGRLELNGRQLDLRGYSIHEQVLGQGSVLEPSDVNRLMGWITSLGAKIIRAHYPLNPEIEEAADRDGILLWSEIPVWRPDSTYFNDPDFVARAHRYLQDNILTNQNHPSILLWSIGNELETPPPPSEARYIASSAALARQLDPTRPVGMAIASWPGVACQPAYGPLQVIGYNDYFGWFDAGGGTTDDRDSLGPYLDFLRACYPNTALMVSEFGFEGNRDGPLEERGTYENQENQMAFHLGVFASKPWLSAAIYFAMQDFAARPGWAGGDPLGNPPWVQKGVIDQAGNIKPAFGLMQSIYRGTVQIAAR